MHRNITKNPRTEQKEQKRQTERQPDRKTEKQNRQTGQTDQKKQTDQTRPVQTRPDKTRTEQTRPDQTRHTERTDRPDTAQQKYIYTGTENQNPVPLGGTPPPLPPKHSARAERKEWWKGWLLQAVPSPSGVLWVEVGSVHVIKAREDKTKHDEKRQDKTRQEKIRT